MLRPTQLRLASMMIIICLVVFLKMKNGKQANNKQILCLTYEGKCLPDDNSRKVPGPQEVRQPPTQRNDKESSVGNGRVYTGQNCRLEVVKSEII